MYSIAIIGCGQAATLHGRTLRKLEPGLPIFYASRQGEKAAGFTQRYNGAGWFNSYDAAFADERIGTVLLTTPPSTHLALALAALRAGKHVIVEKPAFLSTADFDSVAVAALTANRHVLVAENYFYKPIAYALRDVIAKGSIGDVRYLQVNALKWQRAAGWRADRELAGGGPLFEGGIHWINLIANLGLEIDTLTTVECGSPLTTLSTARYQNGAVGTLAYSWETRSLINGVHLSRIYGTRGTATFESNGLFLRVNGKTSSPGLRDLAGYRAMFRDFLNVLADPGRRTPQFTLDLARRDVALIRGAAVPLEDAPATISVPLFHFIPKGI